MTKVIITTILLAMTFSSTAAEAQSLRWHDGHYTDRERRLKEHDYYDSNNNDYYHHHHCNNCGDDDDSDGD